MGYPGQHAEDPDEPAPAPEMAAPWLRNGSYMVFRRLEQKVPEFRRFVQQQAVRLGMDADLLAARMVGRWKSGAPLERAPLKDDPALGGNDESNNDFEFGDDPPAEMPLCGAYSENLSRGTMPAARRRRRGIASCAPGSRSAPKWPRGKRRRHNSGPMFVCYQTSIERQFEFIQRLTRTTPISFVASCGPAGRR